LRIRKSLLAATLAIVLFTSIFIIFSSLIINKAPNQQNLVEKKLIVVTTGIVADVVYNLAGDRVVIKQLLSGQDIHHWEPSTKDVLEASKAALIIYSSRHVETWIDKFRVAVPEGVEFVEAAENVEFLTVDSYVDPHFWFDIRNIIKVTDKIVDALVKIDPENSDYYKKNAEIYKEKLSDLHKSYLDSLSKFRGKVIITRHDAYRYLGNAYGLITASILGIEEEEISPSKMQYLIELVKKKNVKVVFGEYESVDDVVDKFAAEHGLKVLKLYTLGTMSLEDVMRGEGYIYRMNKNLEALVEGLSLE
jgi:zinc transport system substrate-binding protein